MGDGNILPRYREDKTMMTKGKLRGRTTMTAMSSTTTTSIDSSNNHDNNDKKHRLIIWQPLILIRMCLQSIMFSSSSASNTAPATDKYSSISSENTTTPNPKPTQSYCPVLLSTWWFKIITIFYFLFGDPPFILSGVLINYFIYNVTRSCCWHCHKERTTIKQSMMRLFPIFIVVQIIFIILSKETEVTHKREYAFHLENVNKTYSFYRMIPSDKPKNGTTNPYGQLMVDTLQNISDFVNTYDDVHNTNDVVHTNDKDGTTTSTTTTTTTYYPIENIPVTDVKLFDNAIRFDFLLEYRNNPQFTSDFACLIETDVIVKTKYVADKMLQMTHKNTINKKVDILQKNSNNNNGTSTNEIIMKTEEPPKPKPIQFLHVQHMWGQRDFEQQNVGVLCVPNKKIITLPDYKRQRRRRRQHDGDKDENNDDDDDDDYTAATTRTTKGSYSSWFQINITWKNIRMIKEYYFHYKLNYLDLWLHAMSYLNNRRYCRLLYKPLLYYFAPNPKVTLYWDYDHGCTTLKRECNYIHFTRPKGKSIWNAMKIVKHDSYPLD